MFVRILIEFFHGGVEKFCAQLNLPSPKITVESLLKENFLISVIFMMIMMDHGVHCEW